MVVAGRGWHPGRDRDRRRANQGEDRQADARHRARCGRAGHRQRLGPVDHRCRPRRSDHRRAKDRGLLVAGGGHAMAAGLTIDPTSWTRSPTGWMSGWQAAVVARAMAERSMLLDLALAPGGLTPELVETLESAGPYRRRLARSARRSRAGAAGQGGYRRHRSCPADRERATMAHRSRRSPFARPKARWARRLLHGAQGPQPVARRARENRRLGQPAAGRTAPGRRRLGRLSHLRCPGA